MPSMNRILMQAALTIGTMAVVAQLSTMSPQVRQLTKSDTGESVFAAISDFLSNLF